MDQGSGEGAGHTQPTAQRPGLLGAQIISNGPPPQAQEEDEGNESDASLDSGSSAGPNFNYILNMPLWCLTKEKVEELLRQRDLKVSRGEELGEEQLPASNTCRCAESRAEHAPEEVSGGPVEGGPGRVRGGAGGRSAAPPPAPPPSTRPSVIVWMWQKLEAVEREELSSGKGIKLVKGKVGKAKVKKMNLEETLPSLFARRVEPPTQPIKADAAKKLTKKKKVRARRPVWPPGFSQVLFCFSERRRSSRQAGV